MLRVALIIPAAGESRRMGGEVRKPFIELAGRPIVFHTLERFLPIASVEEVVLVLNPRDRDCALRQWEAELRQLGVTQVIEGSARRQDSVLNGLRRMGDDIDVVLVHDAVRPFVAASVVEAVIARAAACGAALAAVPVTSTVKEVGTDLVVERTRPRANLWLAQTPQGFRAELLKQAYEIAVKKGWEVTDDAQVVERFGQAAEIVESTSENLKITTRSDLRLAEGLLSGQTASG